MKFLLANQIKDVELASKSVDLTQAQDKVDTSLAKRTLVTLIASPKGLGSFFAAGVAKGLVSNSNKKPSSIVKSMVVKALTPWILSNIDLSSPDISTTGE